MFKRHVTRDLSAYCHGELPIEESRRVSEHLLACERCRKEYADIKLGVQLAERLPLVEAPPDLWNEIDALLETPRKAAAGAGWLRFRLTPLRLAAAGALAAIVVVSGLVWYYVDNDPCSSWRVARYGAGSNDLLDSDRLAVGQLLETDASSRARIEVGLIGEVEVDPNSRVRLLETCLTEHRLALDRGRMHAQIWAPPRLFFVNTPSAEAIDLGCAYTLEVDDDGRGFLHVTSGWVALVLAGKESYVPMGAMCETRPGIGPGTPYFENATDALIEALRRLDFENGGEAALDVVLEESMERDTFTLWHLLRRTESGQRNRVLERMIELVGLPEAVTRQGVMQLDEQMLDAWKAELEKLWF